MREESMKVLTEVMNEKPDEVLIVAICGERISIKHHFVHYTNFALMCKAADVHSSRVFEDMLPKGVKSEPSPNVGL